MFCNIVVASCHVASLVKELPVTHYVQHCSLISLLGVRMSHTNLPHVRGFLDAVFQNPLKDRLVLINGFWKSTVQEPGSIGVPYKVGFELYITLLDASFLLKGEAGTDPSSQ